MSLALEPGLADVSPSEVIASILVEVRERMDSKLIPSFGCVLAQGELAVSRACGCDADRAVLTMLLGVLGVEPSLSLLEPRYLVLVTVAFIADDRGPFVVVRSSSASPTAFTTSQLNASCNVETSVGLPELMEELPPRPFPAFKPIERPRRVGSGSD